METNTKTDRLWLRENDRKHIRRSLNQCQQARKNCSHGCAYDCARMQYTVEHRTVLVILTVIVQTISSAQMSAARERGTAFDNGIVCLNRSINFLHYNINISTLRQAVLTVLWIGFCHTGPISLCVD